MEFDLQIIKKRLKKGDAQKIADRSKLALDTVYKVLNGKRYNLKVISIAQDIAIENIDELTGIEKKQNKIKASA